MYVRLFLCLLSCVVVRFCVVWLVVLCCVVVVCVLCDVWFVVLCVVVVFGMWFGFGVGFGLVL